eukprot:CAMPEP_0117017860 /NCGR_PEP_ID=MMETSP0472-20121206/13886_1 /TAXON_ID=693140 ORGANISM="Tiarina fusus, Strain LIS" /NCGR_SAMPLE_ID=MMETSP0472 /ASSEMBLY_ACC=CAM_ASM_000603 /LENGTH=194 /DNA_ID=CAMNT_0004722343 /DNA_START=306 /DNA_END=886 /DNA_ORIENTATION=-
MKISPQDDKEYGPLKLIPATKLLDGDEFEESNFGMIMWKECYLIVKTSEYWMNELREAAKQFKAPFEISADTVELWDLLRRVWNLLHAGEKEILEMKKEKFKQQWDLLENFGKAYIKCYPHGKSHYVHIICCHLISLMENYGSLNKFANQGSEACNHYHDVLEENMGQGALSAPTAVIYYNIRMLIYNIPELAS